ncbi:NUDIX hydrolase [Brevibacillus sp. NRS-1366]|uniref:NUDIX hydrolase n=1 Tax=Brevibacillus sp. NRS-1366 TaxID=3233899 RepID=UPI003D23FFC3
MQEEKLDIFDEEGQPIGIEKRSEVHRRGLWHQTFHCWIFRTTGQQIELLFQKRHPDKDTCPNLLDITSAGHLLASEQPSDGVRELEEELGLSAPFQDLHAVGIIRDVTSAPGVMDKEFCHVFLYECDQPLSEYRLQAEEVTGLVWVHLDEIEKLFAGQVSTIRARGFLIEGKIVNWDVDAEVDKTHFVPHEDHYYQQVFAAVKDYAAHRRSK